MKMESPEPLPLLLVDFWWTRPKDPRVPLGHASLLASLMAAGVPTVARAFAVNEVGDRPDLVVQELLAEIERLGGEVAVAFGAYVWGEVLLQAVLPRLRKAGFSGRVILGGPQVSHAAAGVERLYPQADAFVRGYAEQALVEVARQRGRPAIEGVHWRGALDLGAQAPIDLAALPSPYLTGVLPLVNQRFVRWETQRGCPFTCSFCQHREPGAKLKERSLLLERIAREIDLFCGAGVDDIAVLDPIFNAGPQAVSVLERFAGHGYRGKLALQCRAELVEPTFLDAAAALDCKLEFGLQTTSSVEAGAIRRPNNLARVESALAGCRTRGLHHEVSVIFGLPEQTLASFEQTLQWCIERRVPTIKAFPLELLRGTPLDRDRRCWGLIDDGSPLAKVVTSDTMTLREWQRMQQLADALAASEGRHPEDLAGLRRLADHIPRATMPVPRLAA